MVLFVLVTPEPTAAQQPTNVPETKSATPYHLGLGELMTAFVQPRHIKLGLAGKEQNWPYASFELGELTEAFDDIAVRTRPETRQPADPRDDRIDRQAADGSARRGDQGHGYSRIYQGLR
jgi:hypothetical protein